MNERIKELITQAGGYWNYSDFNMPSSVEFQEEDITKFAELVIRECADIATINAHQYQPPGDFVLKYFGVE